ncbi:hypothetical protein [Streptomyces sp. KL116D]|uniref:MmyB family transcriptional regulator n=1 Tax=Streptomyces sp. KL116D TaxID=3045152 RepID=UPI00355738A6
MLGRRMDVLAWNALGDALVLGFSDDGAQEQDSMPRQVSIDPAARDLYPEWPAVAAVTVAYLRLDAGLHPEGPQLAALVGEDCPWPARTSGGCGRTTRSRRRRSRSA